ncbi:APC family permease [Bacillus cereus]|uniref:APC family permease n=1 Tax=Bacillus cereus TaxID=1396 RepID=UPI000952F7B5|nr:APC family permease [Bacillus cereus]OLR26831.1 amino acid permease [Bacillus cereus]
MKSKLDFWSITLLTINSIIGSGIFLSPGSVVLMSGDKAPIVYFAAAIFASMLAITFASAARYITKSGAAYAYAKVAFGENIGLYVGITRFIASSIAWGVMATGVIKTTLSIIGIDDRSFKYVTIGFILLMITLLIINSLGTRLFKIINNLSTIGKIFSLITAIIAGAILVIKTGDNHFKEINQFKDSMGNSLIPQMNTSTFVTSTIMAFYAFTGFESVASGSSDMENPERNLPRAIPLAILIIAGVYIGIVVIAMTINPQAIIQTKDVVSLAVVFDNKIINSVILYGALISMFGINVAASFHTPRILEAMANENQIPKGLAKRTRGNFPLRSFLISLVLSIVLPMTFQYDMTSIIVLSSISRFVQFLIVPAAVIILYYGKNVEGIPLNTKKNVITDAIIPAISFLLTVFLLVKFDWIGQFTIVDTNGISHINIYAILAMVTGYIILPAILFSIKSTNRR